MRTVGLRGHVWPGETVYVGIGMLYRRTTKDSFLGFKRSSLTLPPAEVRSEQQKAEAGGIFENAGLPWDDGVFADA